MLLLVNLRCIIELTHGCQDWSLESWRRACMVMELPIQGVLLNIGANDRDVDQGLGDKLGYKVLKEV